MYIFLTIFAGVSVFVSGQLISKFIIDPIQRQKEIIGEIIFALSFYGNQFPFLDNHGNIVNIDELRQSSQKIRKHASDIRSTRCSIPFYKFWARMSIVPDAGSIEEVSSNLIGWSNSLSSNVISNDRYVFREKVAKLLRVEVF